MTAPADSRGYHIFGPLFRRRPFDRLAEATEKNLTTARISTPGDVYLSIGLSQAIISTLILTPFVLVMHFLGLITLIENINNAFFFIAKALTYSPIIALVLTVFYFSLKPKYTLMSRSHDIDQNIHHASAFLYAMTKSGLQPIDALDRLSQNKNIYGLICEEFGVMVKRVNNLGESPTTALKYVANTTSSKKLKEFIYSFILATEQSLSVSAFFKTKFDEYFEKEKRERATLSENLSIIGEVAVVIVAVAPTLVLATGVSLGVLNPDIINLCNMYLILFLPLSAIMVLFYVKAILPTPKLISVTKAVFTMPLLENIDVKTTLSESKNLDRQDLMFRFNGALRKPITMLFMYPWFYPLIASTIAAVCIGYLYLTGASLAQVVIYSLLAGCLIIFVPSEIQTRYVLSIERRIPDFLRGLAETVEREGSVIKAIDLVLKSRLGLLGREMRKINSTRLGIPLKRALIMVEYRTASIVLKRVLSLLVIASESTRNMKDILMMAADDAEAYIKLRRERSSNLIGQLMATYVSFAVYIYVYYTLKTQFISSFVSIQGFTGMSVFSAVMVQGYYASLILALFLGLIIGTMVEGRVVSGLKHSFVMIVATVAVLGWGP
ncbi:MAG: type II secretion system F family protein [Candidatus Bathyarchaeia archaeon]